jgi:hypothetical protein
MDKEVRPHMCEDSVCGNINSLWWDVLCWLVNSVGVLVGVQRKREIEPSSIYWTHMWRTIDNIQNCDSILICHRHKPTYSINLLGSLAET